MRAAGPQSGPRLADHLCAQDDALLSLRRSMFLGSANCAKTDCVLDNECANETLERKAMRFFTRTPRQRFGKTLEILACFRSEFRLHPPDSTDSVFKWDTRIRTAWLGHFNLHYWWKIAWICPMQQQRFDLIINCKGHFNVTMHPSSAVVNSQCPEVPGLRPTREWCPRRCPCRAASPTKEFTVNSLG